MIFFFCSEFMNDFTSVVRYTGPCKSLLLLFSRYYYISILRTLILKNNNILNKTIIIF